MQNEWLMEAVSNNAVWCNAIAASHDIPAHWDESIWVSEHPMPPFYPNIVTLRSGSRIVDSIDTINPNLPSGWGVKDSFSELDLKGKGFVLGFISHWYCRLPGNDVTDHSYLNRRLETVKNQSELNRWVSEWGESDEVFNFALLKNKSVELVYVEHDDKIVSGLATNISGDSVGVSNGFGSPDEYLSCVALVAERYPTKGIVGYGGKAEVESLSKIGFRDIGDLRVWLHD